MLLHSFPHISIARANWSEYRYVYIHVLITLLGVMWLACATACAPGGHVISTCVNCERPLPSIVLAHRIVQGQCSHVCVCVQVSNCELVVDQHLSQLPSSLVMSGTRYQGVWLV